MVVALAAIGTTLPGESLIIALGATLGYAIGRQLGRHALLKHSACIGLTEARLVRGECLFAKWCVGVVVMARFFVFLRQLNGMLAGSLGLPWWRYVAANMVGGALWVGVWLILSDKVSRVFVAC
ncbi:DedA family protein [Nitrogeniibacter aestuarii]|uniref:DedA family protein n=1 Tax=Nitrogeniibacter aestuarii TaxID=2815343 RepID=UPI001D1118A9|nr:VTT domain-containing protein [Nitrogeniibacter aestuarii]